MTAHDPTQITRMVTALTTGGESAADKLLPLVYDELRALAGNFMKYERADHTLQPTALVNEACARLLQGDDVQWNGRAHFKAVAARAMRRLLINHARDRAAVKRGGPNRATLALNEALAQAEQRSVDVLALDDALERLAALSARQARLVELRFYGGLTFEEAAEVLNIGLTTAKADWTIARAWLGQALKDALPS